jgi:hypothetical protein
VTSKTKAAAPATPKKTFKVGTGTGTRGKKIIIYAGSGMGKSSLAAMAPKPIFIPLDDGTADLLDPFTGEEIQQVEECYTFEDTRAALHQYDLFDNHESIIIDTATKLQDLSHEYMFKTIKHEKGHTVNSIEAYGYGKGYSHLYDTMKFILQDADELIRRGKNVIIICQLSVRSVANAAGEDYLCNTVRLYPGSKNLPPVSDLFIEWADHVLFINHANKAVTNKKVTGDVTRAVFTADELHYKAKSRVLPGGKHVPAVVSFDAVDDDSIWSYIFEGTDDAENKPAMPDDPSEK